MSSNLLPLRTKAGAGDKEPAFIVLRTHACKFLSVLILLSVLVALKFYDNESQFENVKVKLHGVARTLHLSELEHSKAHAEIAKVGEEFERHLDRDLKELEAGQKLLKTLKFTHTTFVQNMTTIIDTEMRKARVVLETLDMSQEASTQAVSTLDETEARLRASMIQACANLFNVQHTTVSALVHRLAEGAKEAVNRREDLQGEIRHNLHEGSETGGDFGDAEGDDWWKSAEGGNMDGEQFETDDHWARETEKWHNQTVDLFFEKLENWVHPNASDSKHQHLLLASNYDTSSSLYQELKKAQEHLKEDVASWRDIQELIHDRVDEIAKIGLPSYTDADEPEDDGYQGFQSWHVQSYLDDLLWPALLRSKLPEIEAMKEKLAQGLTEPISVIDVLESYAADNVIPHHWLHHGGHEYYYGGRDDYF